MSAPLTRLEDTGWSSDEPIDGGVLLPLRVPLPFVATIDGDEGGSGERVKYTTFAREPPICSRFINYSPQRVWFMTLRTSTAICETGSM